MARWWLSSRVLGSVESDAVVPTSALVVHASEYWDLHIDVVVHNDSRLARRRAKDAAYVLFVLFNLLPQ